MQTRGDIIFDGAWAINAACRIEAYDFFKADAHAQSIAGQIEQLAEFTVPADEAHVRVANCDALACEVERILQQVAVLLKCRGGIVDEAQSSAARQIASAE